MSTELPTFPTTLSQERLDMLRRLRALYDEIAAQVEKGDNSPAWLVAIAGWAERVISGELTRGQLEILVTRDLAGAGTARVEAEVRELADADLAFMNGREDVPPALRDMVSKELQRRSGGSAN
jgi:hypothetical protein